MGKGQQRLGRATIGDPVCLCIRLRGRHGRDGGAEAERWAGGQARSGFRPACNTNGVNRCILSAAAHT
jgi:hypothetical protein